MTWNQTRDFNKSKAGSKDGWCLQNTRAGYGISQRFSNAIGAWNGNNEKHADRNIPAGVDVPLFYTFKTDGHVNVQLADGRVWSDGKYFTNLNSYLAAKPAVKYLGWAESLNGVRVISWTPDPVAPPQPANGSLVINAGTWNARTQPNLNSAVIGGGKAPILGGQQYGINAIDGNGWANITFMGQSAWIGPRVWKRI